MNGPASHCVNGTNAVVAIGTTSSQTHTDSVVWITGAVMLRRVRISQLHAAGAAIVDDRDQPVTLRGCNLANCCSIEMWMMDMATRRAG